MKENDSKTQNKPQSKGKKVLLSILNTVVNTMIVAVLIISVLIAVMAISSKADGISTLFGYTIQPIQSDSMKGKSPDGYEGGDFGQGDLMIAKSTDFDPAVEFEVGDIVTFRTMDASTNEYMLIAHRIVDVYRDKYGVCYYQTQGDNRKTSPVPDQENVDEYIKAMNIGSVFYSDSYKGVILKGWGSVLDFLQTQKGFFLVVLLPMIIFFMYELIRVVLNYGNYRKAKAEEDKEQAVSEALAEHDAFIPENMTPEQMEQFKQFLASRNIQPPEQTPADQAQAEDSAPEE